MVDSRAKGRTAEYKVRDILREYTGLKNWERVPLSGAGHIKGDVYLSNSFNYYCIEVKSYKDDQVHSNLLNSSKSQLEKFWDQASREAKEMDSIPILVFKKNRGKWLVAVEKGELITPELTFSPNSITQLFIYLFEDWLKTQKKESWVEERE
jgi:Holliday junction resolvase